MMSLLAGLICLGCQSLGRQEKNVGANADLSILPGSAQPLPAQGSQKGVGPERIQLQELLQRRAPFTRQDLVDYAGTFIGTPYVYASADPATGFDCSGFITYVFNHFNVEVPRSSVAFTEVGREVSLQNTQVGDLILFTGTSDTAAVVGHMGIITENFNITKFIHSTSGRANGVTISDLTDHYQRRFVKVIRVFGDDAN